jgi:quinol monooxygenase YgiN
LLVDMYRIRSLESARNSEIEQSLKTVLSESRQLQGCLGLRLLVNLDNSGVFVAVSYWEDARTHLNAKTIHVAIDRTLDRNFAIEKGSDVYDIVQDL